MQAASKLKNDSCILVVGTTGTGKTSTVRQFPEQALEIANKFFLGKSHLRPQVNIYTGNDLKVGHSAHAETGATITVEDNNHPGAPAWIDNPGALGKSFPRSQDYSRFFSLRLVGHRGSI